ncbi:MAG: beta-hydroxyacyl-ACP dehydratase [Burkholderiaceae bacterium]
MSAPPSLPPVEDLLPHRDSMLLLDCVTDFGGESTTAQYTPRAAAWYADAQGHMPAWIGIELMAQTVAAHVGLVKRQQGAAPKQGVLLGTRSYRSTIPSFAADQPLRIHVTMIFSDASGLGAYDCSIGRGDEPLATATLKVFEPDDFETFLQGSFS